MLKLVSINPTNGQKLGEVERANKDQVIEAVKKARSGFERWRRVSLKKRAQILLKLAALLKQNQSGLAKLISQEMGKPIVQALSEVAATVSDVSYNAKAGLKLLADEVLAKSDNAQLTSVLRYDPVGVVAAIKPWNFPIKTPLLAMAPSLMAGNSLIFKPSEYTALVAKELTKLIWQSGVPKDVFQVLYGSGQVGAMLVASDIDMVSFTGSSQVGKEIANLCAQRLKKFSLELGGSTPAIVLKDADLELAAKAIVWGRFKNAGQVCSAIKRVFVETPVAQTLIDKIAAKVKQLKVGDPLDKTTDLGPLVSEKQLKKLEDQVTRGVVQGGRIITGGRRIREGKFLSGWFHEPTVMIHVHSKMAIMQEETFGPVLPICEVENLDQAIEWANQNPYGLTAVGFTQSKVKAERIIKEVVAGGVYINEEVAFYPGSPWTGLKDSGFGTAAGKYGLWEFTHKRHVHVDFTGRQTRDHWFNA